MVPWGRGSFTKDKHFELNPTEQKNIGYHVEWRRDVSGRENSLATFVSYYLSLPLQEK